MEAGDPFICNDSYDSESSDDEEDAEEDGSQSGDKVTTDNDVEMVFESSYMHNNDLLYDNNHNNITPDKNKVLSKDPFNLYDILNKRKDSGDNLMGLHQLEESVAKRKLSSNNSFCSKRVHTDDSILQLMDELVKAVMGTWVLSSSKLLINSIYAPQDLTKKRVLWDCILHLIDRWDGDCMIMGDFNKVRTEQERYGLVFNVQGAKAFNSFISLASLIGLTLDGYAYTWAYKTANKMSKLDRFLVFKGLLASFPYLLALCLDKNLSDHRPILMRELSIDYGLTPFNFFYSWFNFDGFDKMVEDT
ncbi:RNA-directed DNA polymerase, eukaryota [Tanacetum coccineum]